MTGRFSFIVLALGLVGSTGQANGTETLTHHGTFQSWQVFRLDRTDFSACYAATEASHYNPRPSIRTRPILYVVRYPMASTTNTIEIRFGAAVSHFQSVTAKLIARRKQPRDSVPLTLKSESGFIANETDQAAFLRAMRNGRQVIIVSQPGTDEILEDRYSMFGVTKALAKLETLCPGPQPATPTTAATPEAAELETPSQPNGDPGKLEQGGPQ